VSHRLSVRQIACPLAIALVTFCGASGEEPQQQAAASDASRAELLETFREEFVEITPGEGAFPRSVQMGREQGGGDTKKPSGKGFDAKLAIAKKPGGGDSERPVHKVTFDYRFAVAKYEVPQNLWQAVMGENPSRWKGPRNSVEMLSFEEAQKFCSTVTRMLRERKLIGPNQIVRLPSEAEWEYVARAGTATVYSFGDDVAQLDNFAWYTGNAAGNDPPVGAKKPNPWGLYDIHGYLWEWCLDPWHATYEGAPSDGSAFSEGGVAGRRVLRSGSWKDPAERLTSSYRVSAPRDLRDDAIGLRCILADEPGRASPAE